MLANFGGTQPCSIFWRPWGIAKSRFMLPVHFAARVGFLQISPELQLRPRASKHVVLLSCPAADGAVCRDQPMRNDDHCAGKPHTTASENCTYGQGHAERRKEVMEAVCEKAGKKCKRYQLAAVQLSHRFTRICCFANVWENEGWHNLDFARVPAPAPRTVLMGRPRRAKLLIYL